MAERLHIKRVSWLITLGMAASLAALVLAPMILRAVAAIWPPSSGFLAAIAVTLAYEIALWAPGLLIWIGAQRVGWVRGAVYGMLLTASPIASEVVALRLLGLAAPLSTLGLVTRVLIGAGALTLAFRSGRRPNT